MTPAKTPITRKPLFWIAHLLFFLVCLLYTWKNFNRAFPFIDLTFKMDRTSALKSAADLSTQRGWAPKGKYRDAVSFDVDSATQNFIELEAGGAQGLHQVLDQGIFHPYVWRVRHFAESKTNETQIRFTPDGKPYSFLEKISEVDPGPALKLEEARALAEKAAVQEWGIDFQPYRLVEMSSEIRKSGRADHSFIYEREKLSVGEGKYRLRLSVSGDRLTEVSPYIKVPDAFTRRYSALRSANATLSALAAAAILLIYGIGFCGVGLFFLAKSHWVQWRVPLWIAAGIATLQFLDQLNRLPLDWMDFDTAISTQAFLIREVATALLQGLFDFLIVLIPLIAAESMSRRAFPKQPQLWRIFSREAASSFQVIGRVMGAYLFVGFQFAWVIWIYQFGSTRLGWWNPSELLFHPDELATYFPWLTSIANSLHAGIWEECLFRAVPLAGAALLGNRYGGRRAWITAAFVLQALIFGAAHASYPTQPSYARLVELLVPSAVFGGAYLAFGLLPGILMHYMYDVSLFAMPLFQASGRVAIVSRVVVVGVSLLPLWLCLAARMRVGAWRSLPEALYNRAWRPPLTLVAQGASKESGTAPAFARIALPGIPAKARLGLLLAGVAGLGVWAALSSFKADAPGLAIGRDQAIILARKTLADRQIKLGPEWSALAEAEGEPDEEDLFVWKTSGAEPYRHLMGTYLEPPHWKIRFARFEGDLLERAEEYQVFILNSGEIERVRHELPESRPGASLTEEQARQIAVKTVFDQYGLAPSQLKEVSSNKYQLPARLDWVFTWRDPAQALKQGEARLAVKIAGREVVGYRRYVHVPEEWIRAERGRKTAITVVQMLGGALLSILTLWISFLAVREWLHGHFDRKIWLAALLVFVAIGAMVRLNNWGIAIAQFSTSQPWSSQVLRTVVSESIAIILTSFLASVWLGRLHARAFGVGRPLGTRGDIWLGYAAGGCLVAITEFAVWLGRSTHPSWPNVSAAGSFLPSLNSFQMEQLFLSGAALGMLLFPALSARLKSRTTLMVAYLLVGLAMGAFMVDSSLWAWLGAGVGCTLCLLALTEFMHRCGVALLIPVMATVWCVALLKVMVLRPYPGGLETAGISLLMIAVSSWAWYRKLILVNR